MRSTTLRGDQRAVGDVETLGDDSERAVGTGRLRGAVRGCRTGHEVKAEVADEGMHSGDAPPGVDVDLELAADLTP